MTFNKARVLKALTGFRMAHGATKPDAETFAASNVQRGLDLVDGIAKEAGGDRNTLRRKSFAALKTLAK